MKANALRVPTADGKRFKIDPQRMLYSLQSSTTPRRPISRWCSGGLGQHRESDAARAPEAIDWAGLTAADVVSQLDASRPRGEGWTH